MHEVSSCGFPHSDTCGSLGVCPSPQLFAAYHVFLRLLVPRHPPCALFCLTSFLPLGRLLHSVAALFLYLLWMSSLRIHFIRLVFLFCMEFSRYMYRAVVCPLRLYCRPQQHLSFPDAPAAGRIPFLHSCFLLLFPFFIFFFLMCWQPPAFPCRLQHSILGRLRLNHRVRDGYGCFPQAHRHQLLFVILSVLLPTRP